MLARAQEKKSAIIGKDNLWVGILIIILVLVFGLTSCSGFNPDPFDMVSGDEQLLVLLRNEKDGNYRVRHVGSDPAELHSLKVMLGGQILHVDVQQVVIVHNDQEIVLEPDGAIPANAQVTLAPEDEFDVRVTYKAQTLGGNYMYGFRIGYGDDPQAEPFDLITEFDYAIIVE
jgi:hypothetical protein